MIMSINIKDRDGTIHQLLSRVGKLLIKQCHLGRLKKKTPCERRGKVESIGVLPRGMEFFTQLTYARKLPLGLAKDPRI